MAQSILEAKDQVCRQGFEKRCGAENGQPVTDVRQHQQYEDLKGGHLVTIRLGEGQANTLKYQVGLFELHLEIGGVGALIERTGTSGAEGTLSGLG